MSKQPKKNIIETVQKEIPEFAEACAGLSVEELNNRLAQCAKDAETSEAAKEADEELAEAQAHALLLSAPYKDAKKFIRMKSRYLIALMKEKGGE